MVFAVSYASSAYGLDQFERKGDLEDCKIKYVFVTTVVPDLSLNEDDIFDEFSRVQKYCERKLEVGN
jgi:hypothetical protein